METVRAKGRAAALAGLGPEACPYPDLRKPNGRLTFSRAFRNLWYDGYRTQKKTAPA